MHRREVALVVLVGCALAVLWTWPLALAIGERVPFDPSRSGGMRSGHHAWTWHLWQAQQSLGRGSCYEPTGVLVGGGDLLLRDHPFFWGALAAPLTAWIGAVAAGSVVFLALHAAGFLAAYALMRALALRPPAAGAAAFAWAFAPAAARVGLDDPAALGGPLPPLLLLVLLRWMACGARSERAWRLGLAAAAGALAAMQVLCAPHTALLLAFLALAVAVVAPASGAGARTPRAGLARADGLLVFAAVALIGMLPFLAAAFSERGSLRLIAALGAGVPGAGDLLRPPMLHPFFGAFGGAGKRFELSPGLALALLASAATVHEPRSRRWICVALMLAPAPWWGIVTPETAWIFFLLPVCVAAALFLQMLLSTGRRKLALAFLALLVFERLNAPLELYPATAPPAVVSIAGLATAPYAAERAGAVAVVGHAGGPHVAASWQTVHGRSVLFGPGPLERNAFERWARAAPDLCGFLLGTRLPAPEALAIDLELAEVDHVLLPAADASSASRWIEVLDDMPGWERAAAGGEVAWWYRAALADAVVQAEHRSTDLESGD